MVARLNGNYSGKTAMNNVKYEAKIRSSNWRNEEDFNFRSLRI